MRARTRMFTTLLGTLTAAGLVAGAAAAPGRPGPAGPDPSASAAATLQRLEAQADAAGIRAQRAGEALLQRDDAGARAEAGRARGALVALARRQEPQLAAVARVLGADTVLNGGQQPVTASLTALSARTRGMRAVSFARKQIGKPYGFAAAGPRAYDCSGLTMRAYRDAGRGIGGHGATKQWRLATQRHRMVPFRSVRPGDLIFYGRPGSIYHVAIYSGRGRMIESPYPGKRVREVRVRAVDRLAQVARPAR